MLSLPLRGKAMSQHFFFVYILDYSFFAGLCRVFFSSSPSRAPNFSFTAADPLKDLRCLPHKRGSAVMY